MRDDYLWDRSGTPDPEVERLERLLAPLGHRAPAPAPAMLRAPRPRPWRAIAAAAAVTLAAASLWQWDVKPGAATGWQVSFIEGAARLGGRNAEVSMELRAGEVLRTAAAPGCSSRIEELGRLDLGPDSEMRRGRQSSVDAAARQLHAFIWARPRQFVLDTPSARAIDLGCEYTIDVDPAKAMAS